jgi:hypothetical protein
MRVLALVSSLSLPDCWIGAGFVRNAVWDHLHGYQPSQPAGDVDVIWFDPHRAQPTEDEELERRLTAWHPGVSWSVKNQCRMHAKNDDPPYTSSRDALRFWPETATAVAVRLASQETTPEPERGNIEIAAPFGLDDLFGLIVRPTPRFTDTKRGLYLGRLRTKQWSRIWPRLKIADGSANLQNCNE